MNIRFFSTLLAILLFPICSYAQTITTEVGNQYSIYNVSWGYLLYTYHNGNNQYIEVGNPQKDTYVPGNRSNWNIIYRSDGYVGFRSVFNSNLCLRWYADGATPIQYTCDDFYDPSFFKMILTTTGAYMLKVKDKDQCLVVPSDGKAHTYSCPKSGETVPSAFLWTFVPPYNGARHSHDELK